MTIHSKIQMKPETFFTYSVGSVCVLVVRDHVSTKTHRSVGAPLALIRTLELRGFKRAIPGK